MSKSEKSIDPTDQQDAQTGDLDPAALAAIRSMLEESGDAAPKPKRGKRAKSAKPALPDVTENIPEVEEVVPSERSGPFQELAPQEPLPPQRKKGPGIVARTKARIKGYRPTPRHVVFAGLALFVLLRPWTVVAILFLAVLAVFALFLIFGYDGFWRRAMAIGRWYAKRRPDRAAELHRKMDSFALKWDAFLDRFPEGTVDGLYLPDFGEMEQAEARHDAAVDRRLQEMRENEV